MVRGVEIFKKHFSGYKGQYAFIGGTACDIILGKLGVDFRVTKDLDMVLLIEALNEKFIEAFISFVEEGVVEIDEISVLDLEYLVLFKMKAWLDLSVRKAAGEVIDSKNIKKHKNDVLRLAANIDKDVRIPITNTIKRDVKLFMEETENESVDLKTLGIKNATYEELSRVIYMCYGIEK